MNEPNISQATQISLVFPCFTQQGHHEYHQELGVYPSSSSLGVQSGKPGFQVLKYFKEEKSTKDCSFLTKLDECT